MASPSTFARKSPVYLGEGAHNVMKAASAYVPNGIAFTDPHFIAHRKPVEIGPFRVTPFLVDHSAFDAYPLLLEADGKRVFYSGDFAPMGVKERCPKNPTRRRIPAHAYPRYANAAVVTISGVGQGVRE